MFLIGVVLQSYAVCNDKLHHGSTIWWSI